jgi:hypothetical protein
VLDVDDRPGGAWQHRWDSLSMDDVHGVADPPDAPVPGARLAGSISGHGRSAARGCRITNGQIGATWGGPDG